MHYMRERSLHIDLYKRLCKDLSGDDFYLITGTFSDLRLCQSLLITLREQVRKLEMENKFLTENIESGYCDRAGGCCCGGDLPQIREGCSSWVK